MTSASPKPGEALQQIDIDRISPNRSQPRQDFDPEQLNELARSMQEQGVLQPVVVRPRSDGGFELIAGERRWRAAQLAQMLKIPAVIRDVNDDRMLELALIENIQREDLNAIESALAYEGLTVQLGLTQQEVADRVGKQRATVANALRLLNLPTAVQEAVRKGEISAGHAKALLPLANSRAQIELAERIVRDELNVRRVESIVAQSVSDGVEKISTPPVRDPNVIAAEEMLQSALHTKVRIQQGKAGGGRLELHFHSHDEFERVYQLVLHSARRP